MKAPNKVARHARVERLASSVTRFAGSAAAAMLAAALAAPGVAQAQHGDAAAHSKSGTSPQDAQALFQMMISEIAVQRGMAEPAFRSYIELAQKSGDARFAKRAAEIAFAERSLERTLEAVRLWVKLAPSDMEAANTLLGLLLEGGRIAEAEPLMAARVAKTADKVTAIEEIQRSLVRVPDRPAAFAMFARIAEPYKSQAGVRLSLARAALLAEDIDRALVETRAALKLDPKSEPAVLMTAQLLVTKSPDESAKVLNEFLKRNPGSLPVQVAHARALAAAKQWDAARGAINATIDANPENLDVLFTSAQIAVQARETALAERTLRRYLELAKQHQSEHERDHDEQHVAAAFALAQLLDDERRSAEAIEVLGSISSSEDQYVAAQARIARVLAKDGRIDDARTLLHAVPADSEADQLQLIAAETQILRDARQFQAAFDVLDAALKAKPDQPDLIYDYAMAAEKVDRLDDMERALRHLIQLRPNDGHAYNALGYSLADRSMRLDEALVLLEKANSLLPDDAYILDSVGWVNYRKGKLERAVEFLKLAYEKRPDAEIAAHLGEVLWVAGQHDQASALWRAAHDRDPNNEILVETLARLQVQF
jgi:tetratricopeptide (TPR) repeat protein